MLKTRQRWALSVGAACAALAAACMALRPAGAAVPPPDDAAALAFLGNEVRPLLQAHVLKCPGAEAKIKGGLRLTTRQNILKGGDLGPIVNLEKAHDSLLLRAIGYADDKLQMPPKGKLPPAAIATLTKWVEM